MDRLFAVTRPWEMPSVNGMNRLPMDGLPMPFDTAGKALADAVRGPVGRTMEDNPYWMGLDGTWDFRYYESPLDVEACSVKADDGLDWNPICVPGSWSVQGYDKPHYTNIIMPFDLEPPQTPEENPTGVYRRTFVLRDSWKGRRTVLRVGSAESYLEVYVNGRFAGSSKDTRLPSSYDITDLLHEGENLVALVVVRYSDASYLEDQDQWWFGGIHRSVSLYSTAKAYIADADIRPTLDDTLSHGTVGMRVDLSYEKGTETDSCLTAYLYDGKGTLMATKSATPDKEHGCTLDFPVEHPELWDPEHPNLYTVVLALEREQEYRALRIGFRKVVVADRALLINGKRVFIKGVNRHEHDQCMAKTLTPSSMLEDILLMKRHNFNAVRTCHYPDDEAWYELCDQYGLYVMDEANIECHAFYDRICRDTRWASSFLERGMRMVKRDKNHPSVIIWSLGNESGYGQNHDAMAGWIRRYDPTRPIHYEGAIRPEWGQRPPTLESLKRGKNATDFISPMYPPISLIEEWDRTTDDYRPLIMCEYSHAMGNSNGSLSDYWKTIRSSRGIQGGFIWDWVDQGLLVDEEGKPVGPRGPEAAAKTSVPAWRYGGDFGDTPCDYDFCINGLILPDRTPKPAMAECAKLFQNIAVSSDHPASGVFTVENRFDFSTLQGCDFCWKLVFEQGKEPMEGTVKVPPIESGERYTFKLSVLSDPAVRAAMEESETFLLFEVFLAEDTRWAKAGHRIAWEQFRLSSGRKESRGASVKGGRSVKTDSYQARISEDGFLTSLAFAGREELLDGPLSVSLFRPPTENDGTKSLEVAHEPMASVPWFEHGLAELKFTLTEGPAPDGDGIRIAHEIATREGKRIGRFVQHWQFGEDRLGGEFSLALDDLVTDYPRAGLTCSLPSCWDVARWFGRGPGENYPDRKAGSPIGEYRATFDELYVPYIVPQDYGEHTDVRRLDLLSGDKGVRIRFSDPMAFSIQRFGQDQLSEKRHADELVPDPASHLYLDAAVRGVGTGTCGPDTLERYLVRPGVYSFGFTVSAI